MVFKAHYVLLVLSIALLTYSPWGRNKVCPSDNPKISPSIPIDTIYWEKGIKLSWEDFRGEPDYTVDYKAVSYAGIACHIGATDTQAVINVRSYFCRSHSWIKTAKASDNLLQHELYHFHITEFFARKLRKSIAVSQPVPDSLYWVTVIKFYDNWNECDQLQAMYDHQTEFSTDSIWQRRWEKMILDSLEEYKSYTSPWVKIQLAK